MADATLCHWCCADYYRPTRNTADKQSPAFGILRCPRCGQPDHTCNEVAGRPFRMTWDSRSPQRMWSVWGVPTEDEGWPRSPANVVVTALHRSEEWERIDGYQAVSANFATYAEETQRRLADWTGMPRAMLFGER